MPSPPASPHTPAPPAKGRPKGRPQGQPKGRAAEEPPDSGRGASPKKGKERLAAIPLGNKAGAQEDQAGAQDEVAEAALGVGKARRTSRAIDYGPEMLKLPEGR